MFRNEGKYHNLNVQFWDVESGYWKTEKMVEEQQEDE
jgi:hypothetical protein